MKTLRLIFIAMLIECVVVTCLYPTTIKSIIKNLHQNAQTLCIGDEDFPLSVPAGSTIHYLTPNKQVLFNCESMFELDETEDSILSYEVSVLSRPYDLLVVSDKPGGHAKYFFYIHFAYVRASCIIINHVEREAERAILDCIKKNYGRSFVIYTNTDKTQFAVVL